MAAAGLGGVLWQRAAARLRALRVAAPLGARAASGLSSELLPGPYPRTPEERAAAAKKYNMRVEDYQPYPDDGLGYGDYPMLQIGPLSDTWPDLSTGSTGRKFNKKKLNVIKDKALDSSPT
ncbi:NADH dehydrogenase [ubiquinone] 1 beta subcomplex subunit 8, mitochondrial-like [Cygnus atratus]|uniref:NADH dehydrogenase [ubiquinone] 1 beta subcomplex subunit 8, mitochondrial-like n=1 Tax=Cygnus atratus TaxID=8868 RepID=UPI0021B84ABB|nr:NADH dehydrogenase [ubiquinone] 1 beta subcomplex subunit 8, mitochondrial-like [Cygnus atratus]